MQWNCPIIFVNVYKYNGTSVLLMHNTFYHHTLCDDHSINEKINSHL